MLCMYVHQEGRNLFGMIQDWYEQGYSVKGCQNVECCMKSSFPTQKHLYMTGPWDIDSGKQINYSKNKKEHKVQKINIEDLPSMSLWTSSYCMLWVDEEQK